MRSLRMVIVVLLLAAVGVGGWFAYNSDAMRLRRVEVVGNENVTAEEVVEKSSLVDGVHLLRMSTPKVSRMVENISWVASARVERILPSKVRIVVRERIPAAVVIIEGDRYLIDRNGTVLAQGERPLPVISELTAKSAELGSKISSPQIQHVFSILEALDADLRSQTSSIRAPSVDRITLVLDSGTEVLFGAAEDLEDKNFATVSLLERYRAENKQIERLDVRVPLRPAVKLR